MTEHALGGASAWIAGSDRPEKQAVRIGFMPLTDCAPVVMAAALGFDKKYGIIFLESWPISVCFKVKNENHL